MTARKSMASEPVEPDATPPEPKVKWGGAKPPAVKSGNISKSIADGFLIRLDAGENPGFVLDSLRNLQSSGINWDKENKDIDSRIQGGQLFAGIVRDVILSHKAD